MRKQMFGLSVELRDDGVITLSQQEAMDDPSIVLIAPEQVGMRFGTAVS